jgi:esterase/lipase superfamily enzyme
MVFVTDRVSLAEAQLFGGERATTPAYQPILTYGVIGPNVDRAHLQRCSSQAAFLRAFGKRFPRADARRLFVYVHGYDRTFKQSAESARTLQGALRFTGPVMLYSWPSKVTCRLAYVNDETNAGWAMPHFNDVLAQRERSHPKLAVSFTSHRLGGRFAAAGRQDIRQSAGTACLGRSALFAPDVDSDTMRDEFTASGLCSAPPVPGPKPAAPVTLYVSSRDKALQASQKLHAHQRAGQAGSELILCNGVNAIDVSRISGIDKARHTYHDYPDILRDVAAAVAGTVPAYPGRNVKAALRPAGRVLRIRTLIVIDDRSASSLDIGAPLR